MELIIADGAVTLTQPDVLTALSVRTDTDPDATRRLLADAGLGHAAGAEEGGEHAWLDVAALRDRAGAGRDAAWQDGYAAMIGYAESRGWVSADGGAVRAHLEQS